jgi:hypothetical protein
MKITVPGICAGLMLSLALSESTLPESTKGMDLEALVPPISEGEDWQWGEVPTEYEPENLFEYLNGGAPQYLSYGFVSLLHARYAYKGRDLESVTLDIYDMGSRLGAYGVYTSGRPREVSRQKWGVEGYRSGTVAAAWKNRIYIRVTADDEIPVLIDKLEALLDQVTQSIPGKPALPPQLSLLPDDRLVSGSDRYIGKNLLGHSFLPGGFLASYEWRGGEGLLFICDLKSPETASKAFGLLRSYEIDQGEIVKEGKIGDRSFWAQDPGLGHGIVLRRLSYVAGVWGIDDVAVTQDLATALDNNLRDFESGDQIQ